jgi:hypothetical protein
MEHGYGPFTLFKTDTPVCNIQNVTHADPQFMFES